VHIFLNSLRTDHTEIGSNVVDQLFESGRTIGSPKVKVSLMGGDLSIEPNANAFETVSAPGPQKQVCPSFGNHSPAVKNLSHYRNLTQTTDADVVHQKVSGEQRPPPPRRS
jgi:hypothetical protein